MEVLEEPIALPKQGCLVQNLGPDTITIGEANVSSGDGITILINEAIAIGNVNQPVYVISDGTSDVRLLGRGTGMFSSG